MNIIQYLEFAETVKQHRGISPMKISTVYGDVICGYIRTTYNKRHMLEGGVPVGVDVTEIAISIINERGKETGKRVKLTIDDIEDFSVLK
ncbi:hypothetical protein [Ancylomarina longa]|uniref:Uncharacterized protein n=1 Tax=Ancylomarina longa TaxID=2487017 RepID=A0A434AGH9_9BACT|nr:hypothetical protein [Ancylomarina longa]RUT73491.1 hypothetical protein DLK05_12890 [Ancylomarina longa]